MRFSKDGYYRNQHSCFLLQYHLVLITKYRHPVLVGELKKELLAYTEWFFKEQGCTLQEVNTDVDHIHILFDAPPQATLSKIVNAYKSASSRRMRKMFGSVLEPYYWKPYFWGESYFLGSVSERTTSIVREYIRNQQG